MFETGVSHDGKVVGCGLQRCKKTAPGNRNTGGLEGPGHGQTVRDVRVEGRIGDKKIFRPGLLQLPGGPGDGIGTCQSVLFPLDMGIGAVNTLERAAPLALQIQHAPLVEVKFQVSGVALEFSHLFPGPGQRGFRRGRR